MSDKKQLVSHDRYFDLDNTSYSESETPGVLGTLTGQFSVVGESRNGNEYVARLWESIFSDPRIKEMIDNKTFYGELSHPPREAEYLSEVQMSNVSHNIIKLEYDTNTKVVTGWLDILDTPSGRIVDTLVRYGSKLGISSRGILISESTTNEMTPENYYLVTWDLVALPGVEGCRLNPVTESLGNTKVADKIKQRSISGLESSITEAIKAKDFSACKVFRACLESADIPNKDKLSSELSDEVVDELIDTTNLDEVDEKTTEDKVIVDTKDTKDDVVTSDDIQHEDGEEVISTLESVDPKVEETITETTDVSDVPGPTNGIYVNVNTKESKDKLVSVLSTLESVDVSDDTVTVELPDDKVDDFISLITPVVVEVATNDTEGDESAINPNGEDPLVDDSILQDMQVTVEEIKDMLSDVKSSEYEKVSELKEIVESLTAKVESLETDKQDLSKSLELKNKRLKSAKESYYRLESDKNAEIAKLAKKNSKLVSESRRAVNESMKTTVATNKLRLRVGTLEMQLASTNEAYTKLSDKYAKESGLAPKSIKESKIEKLKKAVESASKITSIKSINETGTTSNLEGIDSADVKFINNFIANQKKN